MLLIHTLINTPSGRYYSKHFAYAYRNNHEEESTNVLILALLQEYKLGKRKAYLTTTLYFNVTLLCT